MEIPGGSAGGTGAATGAALRDRLVRDTLRERHDPERSSPTPRAYYGAQLHERTLVPEAGARLAETLFERLTQRAHRRKQLITST